MATASTTQVNSYCPYVTLEVTSSSSTGGSATYAWTLKYVTVSGYTLSTSSTKLVTAKVGSTTVYNSYITVGGKSSYTISSGTVTLSKSTSSQTITASVSIAWGSATWSGTTMGTRSGSTTFTLAAKTSYTIVFNANGGSGAPSSQTKWYGTTLTLSSTKPTRSYYTFSKWNTNSSGTGTSYSSGGSYTANAAATLYAIWTGNTYTITYNANGGSNAPASTTKKYGSTGTITTAVPTRTNYNFLGWATSSSSTTVTYKSGATLSATSITSSITLYAVWELAHVSPTISGLTAFRCDSSGNALNTGSYASVSFSWVTYDDYEASSLTVTGSSSTSITVSGTSGTVSNQVIAVSADDTTIKVVLTDSASTSTTATFALAAAYTFLMGFTADGTGAAIGKLPETSGIFECALPIQINIANSTNNAGLTVTNTTENKNSYIRVTNEWSGYSVELHVGTGGYNRGIYDRTVDGWLIYRDSSNNTHIKNTTYLHAGALHVETPNTSGETLISAKSWSGTELWFGVGSGGYNRGIYDNVLDDWMIYRNSDNDTVISNKLICNGSLFIPNYGVAIANGYGIYHYLASGSDYAKFEYLNTSNEFILGNTSYTTRIYAATYLYGRSNKVLFAPRTAYTTSNTGIFFQIQANASETFATSTSSANAVFCVGSDSTSIFMRSYAAYARTGSTAANVNVTSSGTFNRYSSSASRYKNTINYFDNVEYASDEGLAKREYTVEESDYRDDYRSILKIPVVQFHYNEGYITGEADYDYTKYVTSFIAEDVEKNAPACATYTEDGKIEAWDHMQMIPRMVALLQEHERRLDALEASA